MTTNEKAASAHWQKRFCFFYSGKCYRPGAWRTETLAAGDVEMLLLVTATEEHFSATVHARTSYKFHEIECNADFEDMYLPESPDGVVRVDAAKLHSTRREENP